MKTTIDLPNELVREIKLKSVMEGRNLKESVAELLRLGLAASTGGIAQKGHKGRVKLPLFQCETTAPVRRMSNAEIHALTHETQTNEDLERLGLPV